MKYPTILAIETSTEILSLAVRTEQGMTSLKIDTGLKHNEVLMDAVASLLSLASIRPADLTGLVCSRGPGSFTGLRIGMAAAKGLASGLNLPLASVGTLEIFCALGSTVGEWPVYAFIDAKMEKFYWAGRSAPAAEAGSPKDSRIEEVLASADLSGATFVGTRKDLELLTARLAAAGYNFAGAAADGGTGFGVEAGSSGGTCTEGGTANKLLRLEELRPAAEVLLELGASRLAAGYADSSSQGPEYVRSSQAEEARSRMG